MFFFGEQYLWFRGRRRFLHEVNGVLLLLHVGGDSAAEGVLPDLLDVDSQEGFFVRRHALPREAAAALVVGDG